MASSGLRGRLINAVLAIVVTALCVVAGEAILRNLPVAERFGWSGAVPVEDRIAAVRPKTHGTLRILALGDSFTEWRDTDGLSFIRVAARDLGKAGMPVDVVNLAEAGTGIPEYRANFARAVERVAPDLVVIGLYLGNDLREANAVNAPAAAVSRGIWWKRLLKQSVLLSTSFRLAKRYIPALRSETLETLLADLGAREGRDAAFVAARLAAADPVLVEAARADTINTWDLATGVFFPDYYEALAEVAPDTRQGAEVAGGIAALDVLIAECRAHNAVPIVVLLPPPVWTEARTLDYFHRLGYGATGPLNGPVPVVELLKRHLAALSVPTVDPLSALRAESEPVYLQNDEHLNGHGQTVVGAEVARQILALRR